MFDINRIREDQKSVERGLSAKNSKADLTAVLKLDEKRRELQSEVDKLRSQKNEIAKTFPINRPVYDSKAVGWISSVKDVFAVTTKDPMKEGKSVSAKIKKLEPQINENKIELDKLLINIPNLPHETVPVGGVENNQVIREEGKLKTFDFKPKTHIELAEDLDIVDFKRSAKLSGSNFILLKGAGACLERALINFMLDLHTKEHGYREVHPPVLATRDCMTGTGQLPKMEDDMYCLKDEDLFLIPTAEVPVTNIHREEILKEEDLPIYYTAYTACFRREAGSYGKDTRGLVRVHQFNKVEMVKFVSPDDSYKELESLVENAEKIFKLLELPYRVVLLASGDLSFAAAKCYDLEVHAPGLDKWLEASSCSNFEDFQARRAGIRFKDKETKKNTFVHTLNGSGVALPRTVTAILENYQTRDGDVVIPEILQPYMDGLEKIKKL